MSIEKIILLGKIPPPIGGVTVSVKNLIQSLEKKGIVAELLSGKNLFKRYDVAHIHYSNLLKRALGIIIARILSRKVIFTVHGKFLDCTNIFNRISIWLCDGIVVLNTDLYNQIEKKIGSRKLEILPSLFAEGFNIDGVASPYFKSLPEKETLLLYAYDRSFCDNEEVYGVEFLLNNLDLLPDKYQLVLLDISGKYHDLIDLNDNKVIYINKTVNFIALLKQVDVYIRPTCMDGASVAVQEAQLLGVPVLASDVVNRPVGVTVFRFKDFSDFLQKLEHVKATSINPNPTLKSVGLYIDFCENL